MALPHRHVGKPRGLVVGHHWQSAIKSNGKMPTIYPMCHAGGPIPGFMHKNPIIGKWSGSYHGKHH